MQYVYVIYSNRAKVLYTGCTNDLKKRLALHNAGKVKSTMRSGPFELVFYEAFSNNKHDGFEREQYLMGGEGIILKRSPETILLAKI